MATKLNIMSILLYHNENLEKGMLKNFYQIDTASNGTKGFAKCPVITTNIIKYQNSKLPSHFQNSIQHKVSIKY